MTYYVEVTPVWPHQKTVYELEVEAQSHRMAIDVARATEGVALVTDVRDRSLRLPLFAEIGIVA